MTEKININGKEVWVVVEPHPTQERPEIIPNQYFTATYHMEEPKEGAGETLVDEGEPAMFESPVAALAAASKRLKEIV